MMWTRRSNARGSSQRRSNILAGLTLVLACGFLYLNFDPTPAGADGAGKKTDVSLLASALPPIPTPAAPAAATLASKASAAGSPAAAPKPAETITRADRIATQMNLMLLELGHKRLSQMNDYTCTFYKQERIGEELLEGQFMDLKMRHKPFSVYMKWLNGEKGRELLYVDGTNDNKMIVHPGGWKARLVPAMKLEPDGALAMRETRHPVTMVGLLKLCEEIVTRRKAELKEGHPVRCEVIENQVINERPCYCFLLIYLDRKLSQEYRKSIQYIDKEWLLPVCVKNYAWPPEKQKFSDENALDEATLIEHYAYSELQFNQQLADGDFDRGNTAYNFKR